MSDMFVESLITGREKKLKRNEKRNELKDNVEDYEKSRASDWIYVDDDRNNISAGDQVGILRQRLIVICHYSEQRQTSLFINLFTIGLNNDSMSSAIFSICKEQEYLYTTADTKKSHI
jgi:hypothetical protein